MNEKFLLEAESGRVNLSLPLGALSDINRALGMIEGISYTVGEAAGAALVDAVQMIEESLKPEVNPEQKAREEGHLVICGKKMDSRICDGNCDKCDERNAELHAILCDFFSKQANAEKHCSECDLTDGTILKSDPPQVRCPVTGKFHKLEDVCDCSNGRNRNA